MLILRRVFQSAAVAVAAFALMPSRAADLDPKAVTITLPENIPWKTGPNQDTAMLVGDPSKPGLYIQMLRWHAGNNSRPHFHSTDRYITVLSGNWYMGTGAKYDHEGMKPLPAGSFVIHHANEIHYDGAIGADCVLYIVGTGPMTTTQAEQK